MFINFEAFGPTGDTYTATINTADFTHAHSFGEGFKAHIFTKHDSYTVTSVEYVRVLPLLTGEPQAPALPADVIAAYRKHEEYKAHYFTAVEYYSTLENLISTIGKYMPSDEVSS